MPRRVPPALWLVLPLAYFLYFHQLAVVGLIGPDEPRYAAIARTMAVSGDWITPRLLGQPWFEKPALLYWIEAIGFRAGLGPEIAPRLPVAILAVAFLAFYWWILRREFSCLAAHFATAILATSAAWMVSSQIGTTDLPLAAAYATAMLAGLPWVRRRDAKPLPYVAALLGLAVLAKGPVAAVLAFPLVIPWKGPWRSELGRNVLTFLRPRVAIPFLAVTLPWYVLCAAVNGTGFLRDFFWKHNVERFVSSTVVGQHGQPWWYFAPVLLGLLLPWTPLIPLALRGVSRAEPGRRFLLVWAALWLVFFSCSANKLPLYILPMIPAVCALLGIALTEAANAAPWLAACALLLVTFAVAAPLAPVAVASGLSHTSMPRFHWIWLVPLAVAAVAWTMARTGRRWAAVLAIASCAAGASILLKNAAGPEIDRLASARSLHREFDGAQATMCVDWVPRKMEYSLDYYFVPPLPKCTDTSRPLWLHQVAGQLPAVEPAKGGH